LDRPASGLNRPASREIGPPRDGRLGDGRDGDGGDDGGDPRHLVPHVHQDVEARRELPGEEAEDHGVERDVRGARVGVALLHRRDQRRGHRPHHRDAGAGEEVRPREELPDAEVGVKRTLDGEENAGCEEDRSARPVLVAVVPRGKLLWCVLNLAPVHGRS